jgi:hypothetical protein
MSTKPKKTVGLLYSRKYNGSVMRWLMLVLALSVAVASACADRRDLPDDPQLEVFIRTMARCANVERAYSGNVDMFEREMADIEFPPDWQGLVDSLLATYGGDPDFWQSVYEEILERSRLPAQEP